VDHFFGRVDLFSWTTGSILLDSWIFGTGIYKKEFYDGFEIQEGPGDIQPLPDSYDGYFTPLYAASQSLLQQFREEAEKARKLGDRVGEAGALRRVSDLLYENMCPAMPWFNIESGDFFLPSDKQGWWAVMVEFYY
jgi:hypothetical protein